MLVNGSTNRHVIKYKGILSNFNMHKWHYLQSLLSKHKFITLWYDNDKIVTVRHKNKKILLTALFSSLSSCISNPITCMGVEVAKLRNRNAEGRYTEILRVFAWHIELYINPWCTLLLYSIHCIGTSSIYMINNLL